MKGNYETMEELVSEVVRIEEAKADYVVSTAHMEYGKDGDVYAKIGNGTSIYRPTEFANGQIADRLQIPRKFWHRMDEYNGLKAGVVSEMWHQRPDRRLVRTVDDTVRAFLSDRYRPMDNMLVLGALMPTMQEHQDLKVVSRALGEQRLYLQVVFPRVTAEVVPGDVVQAGVTITNSEVGAGAVDVQTMVWRLVCSNGMVGSSLVRKTHVGARIDSTDSDSLAIFKDDTIKAEIESFRLRLRDVFAAAVTDSAFQAHVAKMRAATEDRVDDVIETAKNVTRAYGVPDGAYKAIAGNVLEERNHSRYGFANALTWYAQSLDDRDRQYDMERAGHAMITMSAREWKQIAA